MTKKMKPAPLIDWFEQARARNTDPDTSHIAAAAVDANRLEAMVLASLRSAGARGMVVPEIALRNGMPRDSISPRMVPLEERKLVARAGKRHEAAFSRTPLIVWVLHEFRPIDAENKNAAPDDGGSVPAEIHDEEAQSPS